MPPNKYDPLRHHMDKLPGASWTASFADIERIVGRKLPPSAHNYREWWANNDASVQAKAWMSAGWMVESVHQLRGAVTFRRAVGQTTTHRPQPAPEPQIRPTAPTEAQIARLEPAPSKPALAPYEWDKPDLVDCRAVFRWQPVGRVVLNEKGMPVFPVVPVAPGLYRFQIRGARGHASYVGETEDLQRRLQDYRTPGLGQLTNIRIRDRLVEALRDEDEAAVAIVASDAWIEVQSERRPVDLAVKAARLFLENAALMMARSELIESLNR